MELMVCRRGKALVPLLALLALLAAGGCGERQPPPNIVLVTIDTLRADRVGVLGGQGQLTPNLDQLAGESAVFLNAVSPMGTTQPAHTSIFTGLYPRAHHVRRNGHRLADRFETLAERLQAAGYDTAAFVAMPELLRGGNLQQGTATHTRLTSEAWETRPGSEVNQDALDWLEHAGSRPFYLWLHYFEVHAPYRFTARARELLPEYDGPLKDGVSVDDFYSYGRKNGLPPTEESRRLLSALYDGEVLEADLLLGQVVTALKDLGLYDRTVIIVAADHGQHLGDHDRVGHGFSIWEEVIHVPLIIRDPGSTARPRSPIRVGLIDLFPTVLEYAGLAVPDNTAGRSLVRDVRGEAGPSRPYLAESRPDREGLDPVAVMAGPRKLVLSKDGVMAFDLEADPGESRPLPEPLPEAYDELLDIAAQYRALGRKAGRARQLDAETLERLRTLGYVE